MIAPDSPERRVKRGCSIVLLLLVVVTAVSFAENGWSPITWILTGMGAFTLLILIVVNLPDSKK